MLIVYIMITDYITRAAYIGQMELAVRQTWIDLSIMARITMFSTNDTQLRNYCKHVAVAN